MLEIVIATGNAGKVREFWEMLGSERIRWRSLDEFPQSPAVEETGLTFRENACLKAAGYARALGHWALADDSGLEVDALQGNPGVYSARWAQMNAAGSGDSANNDLVLEQMKDVPQAERRARFVCVLALADPNGTIVFTTRDVIEGQIGFKAVGSNGFGYDPLFYLKEIGQTTAELSADEKHRISHRGRALRRMKKLFNQTNWLNNV